MGRWRRWTAAGALVALVLAAGCTVQYRPDPLEPAPPPPSRVPVASGTTVATRAFLLDRTQRGDRVRTAPAGRLPVAMRRLGSGHLAREEAVNLLLVFPLLRSPPRCLRQVELWLRVLRYQTKYRYQGLQIAAYPSLLVSLASDRPTARTGGDTLIDNRPRGTATLTADRAWMHFDITELYRTWAAGGPFPTQLRTIEPATPLVVDVRPEAMAEPYFEARFAPLHRDADTAPQLRWRARSC